MSVYCFDVYVSQNVEESSMFHVEVPEIKGWTQARNVQEIEAMARELIAVSLDIDADSFNINFPHGRI